MLRKCPFIRKYIESAGKGINKMGTRKEILPISLEDRQFFEEMYEEYKNFMFYSARKYVYSQSECEDIVQDAVERLLRNITTIRALPSSGLRKYLVLTIRTTFLDSMKREHGNLSMFLDESTIDVFVTDEVNLSINSDGYSSISDVERLKRELPKRDWFVLEGKYIMGYSQSELAQMIGVSPDSIRMIICRAKKKARTILFSK